jgi:hypothetical protein
VSGPAKPKLEDRAQRRKPDSGRQAQEPPAEFPGQRSSKPIDIRRMPQQCLSDKQCVFGVVADHPSAEKKTVPHFAPPPSRYARLAESLGGQSQSVTDGGAYEHTLQAVAQIKRCRIASQSSSTQDKSDEE